jgi:hypothetical protein
MWDSFTNKAVTQALQGRFWIITIFEPVIDYNEQLRNNQQTIPLLPAANTRHAKTKTEMN